MDLQKIIDRFNYVAANPGKMLADHLAGGKKVVGCFPSYTPEELITAAGMVPMGLWGGQTEPFLAKQYLPAFACPILQSNLEFGLQGKYRGLSAVLIPTLCDTFRCITQDWLYGVRDIEMIPVSYPQNRTEAGIDFLANEFGIVRGKLEKTAGHPITDGDIEKAIGIYRKHSEVMTEFTCIANEHLDIVTPLFRHRVMKSAWFMEKAEHTELVENLIRELKKRSPYRWQGIRVLLTGIASEPESLLEIMAENNIAVVGDDLAQESRQYRASIPVGTQPVSCLAEKWKQQICSLAHDANKSRVDMLVDMAETTGAKGVVACMMKFCDPEEYDYPLIAEALKNIGVPTLYLEVDQQPGSTEQIRTRIQTFSEMLS